MNKIEEILSELFTNGNGEKAERLQLKIGKEEKDGGGWCRGSVHDILVKHLVATPQPETVDAELLFALKNLVALMEGEVPILCESSGHDMGLAYTAIHKAESLVATPQPDKGEKVEQILKALSGKGSFGDTGILTVNILRNWTRDWIERFATHLLGNPTADATQGKERGA